MPEAKPESSRANPPQNAAPAPELVFKPDARQAARAALIRALLLVAGAGVMLAALLLVLFWRPRAPADATSAQGREDSAEAPRREAEGRGPDPEIMAPESTPTGQTSEVASVRLAAAQVDTLLARAAERWLRAGELAPQAQMTRDNSEPAARLRKAAILAESARKDIALAREQAEAVRSASRIAGSAIAFRLSVLYAALDGYLKTMDDDASDRHNSYRKLQASAEAALAGDEAEAEIQQNVATSYLRRSEQRQRSLRRLAQQVRESLRNLEDGGR